MLASQNGEITYYEELGVEQAASAEEIHDAFRALVRLLHPDQQIDPLLKIVAEKQMRKLNRIYAVLSDPERRRRYDETLEEEGFPPTIIVNAVAANPNVRRLIGRMAWIGAALVSAILLIWLASQNNSPAIQTRSRDQAPASYDSATSSVPAGSPRDSLPPERDLDRLRSRLRAVTVERDAAMEELTRLRGGSAAGSAGNPAFGDLPNDPSSSTVALTELPATSKSASTTLPGMPDRVEPAVNRHLAGFWFYTKPARGQLNTNRALYLPEFIEATITEENGVLRGKYRSRFLIADRAISPDVNFSFSGVVNGPTVTCPWIGSGGAKGEVTLTLMPNNSMRIDWSANEQSNQLALASGTAVLTRRIE